jgi:hypothetical protein
VDAADLAIVLSSFGPCTAPTPCPQDVDCNGLIDRYDERWVLFWWGECAGGESAGGGESAQGGEGESGDDSGALVPTGAVALLGFESIDAYIEWAVAADESEAIAADWSLHALLNQ